MGNRLSKIYTRTGDDGTTGLGDGQRVPKDHARVEAYGDVDELNSAIGVLLAVPGLPKVVFDCLTEIQHELFDLGGELCIPGSRVITAAQVARLEQELDAFNEPLPPLKDFILPGGGPMAAACHLARTVARRAERRVWSLTASVGRALARHPRRAKARPTLEESAATPNATINAEALRYLNRLSDLLFVIARVLVRHERGSEVLWRHDRRR